LNLKAKKTAASMSALTLQNGVKSVSVLSSDLNGIPRGKVVPVEALKSNSSPIRLSNIISMLDFTSMPFMAPEGSREWWPSWSEGWSDIRAIVDPRTARRVPWKQSAGLLLCDFEHVKTGQPYEHLPRATLGRVLNRLSRHGYAAVAAQEIEFMLFRESADTILTKKGDELVPLWSRPHGFGFNALNQHDQFIATLIEQLTEFGLNVEGWSTEAGPSQMEINLAPMSGLDAADQAFLFKMAVREIAARNDLFASFIPKIAAMGFGNGNHLNLSLWKGDKNAFFDSKEDDHRSQLMRKFIAGVLATLREFTLLYAPTINSYRRFIPYFSPGNVVAWSHDNRSVAVRTTTESEKLTRIELRTAGADVNPYLLMAGVIAGGLYGIENQLECPPPVLGDAYGDKSLEHVPNGIEEAISLLENSVVAKEYLGVEFVRFFVQGRKAEVAAFHAANAGEINGQERVTDWEVARYLEYA